MPSPPPKQLVSHPSPRTIKIAQGAGETKTNADNWQPPSVRPEAIALINKLKLLEAELAKSKAWTPDQTAQVKGLLQESRTFLDMCKAEAVREIPIIKKVQEKLETKYVKLYAQASNLLSGDDKAWSKLLALGQKLESHKTRAFGQSSNNLIPMYAHAVEVQPTFDSTFQQIATNTKAEFTAAAPKHLFRALEKMSMKPANDPNLDRAVNVCDVGLVFV